MTARSTGVYLSAVTSEFGRARQEIARSLSAQRFDVQVQEEFALGGDTLLEKIEDYVKACQAVVAIVGTRSGAFPAEAEARPFADVVSAVGLTPGEYSYTEWELIFARYYERKLFLFVASPDYQPDRPTPEGDRPEVQARVVSWLRSQGLEWSEFTDVRDLLIGVLTAKLDTVAGVRRSTSTTDEGLDVTESGRRIRRRDPAEANRLPPNRHPLVGRDRALEDVLAEIDVRFEQLIMLVGEPGIGKRAVLQELANSDDLPSDLANGAGITPVFTGDDLEDLQQAIWEEFFEVDDPSMVDPRRRLIDLESLESLIFLPDIDPSAHHLPELLDCMPRSFFCVSAQEDSTRDLPGEEIPLDPLDDDAAIAVFEIFYREPIPAAARTDVIALCQDTGGNPGRIELLAKDARKNARRHRGDDDPLAVWVSERLGHGPAPAESDAGATATAAMAAVNREIPRDVLADATGSSSAIDEGLEEGGLEAT